MTNVVLVIQARMGSTRLPGKVLADVNGQPMLGLMLDRLEPSVGEPVVVATSDDPLDDPIAKFCAERGTAVVRASEGDVLSRFVAALDAFPAEHLVRLTADCPLSDPQVVRAAIDLHLKRYADYTSNTLVRTFPDGLDVEVLRAGALREAAVEAVDPIEREHVTPFVYRRPERYQLAALRNPELYGAERWTIDTPEDLEFVRDAVSRLPTTDAPWREILRLVGPRHLPEAGGLVLRPCTAADEQRLLDWRNDPAAVASSGSRRPVDPIDHHNWLLGRLECPATRIWIGEVDGTAIGMVRIDVRAGGATVSVAVDAAWRNRGWGRALIASLLHTLGDDYQVVHLRAKVDESNAASLRLFRDNGFAPLGGPTGGARRGEFVELERGR